VIIMAALESTTEGGGPGSVPSPFQTNTDDTEVVPPGGGRGQERHRALYNPPEPR
jgi:hypothetical protein